MTTVAEMTRSMSRVGNFIDNAPIENFFGHFKCERYDLKNYRTFEELEKGIDAYIKQSTTKCSRSTSPRNSPVAGCYCVPNVTGCDMS